MIIQQGTGYQYGGTATVNGTNKKGIELTIAELNSEKTYTMRTGVDGFYYSINIPEGEYKITRLFLRNENHTGWASIAWTPRNHIDHKVEIISGRVNNFGTINWECESGVKNRIQYNREYGQVRDSFRDKHKSSNWNEKEWIITGIRSAH